jgi:hypothetical protein
MRVHRTPVTRPARQEQERRANVLVVANRTASTPRLLAEVARRAKAKPSEFTLLIPSVRETADWTRETAVELVSRAAREPVAYLPGGPDPFAAVHAAISDRDFDEIIISTPRKHAPRWPRRGLIHRVEHLGLPVTAVIPPRRSIRGSIENSDDVWRGLGVTLAPSVCCTVRDAHR